MVAEDGDKRSLPEIWAALKAELKAESDKIASTNVSHRPTSRASFAATAAQVRKGRGGGARRRGRACVGGGHQRRRRRHP